MSSSGALYPTSERRLKDMAQDASKAFEDYKARPEGTSKKIIFAAAVELYIKARDYAKDHLENLKANPISPSKDIITTEFKMLKYSLRSISCYPNTLEELKANRKEIFRLQNKMRDLQQKALDSKNLDSNILNSIGKFVNGFAKWANQFVAISLANVENQLKSYMDNEIQKKLLKAKEQIPKNPFLILSAVSNNNSSNSNESKTSNSNLSSYTNHNSSSSTATTVKSLEKSEANTRCVKRKHSHLEKKVVDQNSKDSSASEPVSIKQPKLQETEKTTTPLPHSATLSLSLALPDEELTIPGEEHIIEPVLTQTFSINSPN